MGTIDSTRLWLNSPVLVSKVRGMSPLRVTSRDPDLLLRFAMLSVPGVVLKEGGHSRRWCRRPPRGAPVAGRGLGG